jgi:hypothetical protein
MSKGTSTPQEAGSPLAVPGNQGELPGAGTAQANPGAANPKPEQKEAPPLGKKLLTVEQFLKRAKQDQGIADLIRSLHRTKIMSFADWERETAALLKKKVW